MDSTVKGIILAIVIGFLFLLLFIFMDKKASSKMLLFDIYDPQTAYDEPKKVEIYNGTYHVALEEYEELQKKQTLVYNRVPKCGSATALRVLGVAAQRNKNIAIKDNDNFNRELSEEEQYRLILRLENNYTKPWFYNRHVHFLNFTHFGQEEPIYINLVRHPVDRFVSRYYFGGFVPILKNMTVNECIEQEHPRCTDIQTKWETLILVPFFCGQDIECTSPSSYSMQKAKMNTVKYYAFVGILDEFKYFFKLAECFFPKFFTGAYKIFLSKRFNKHDPHHGAVEHEKLTDHNRKIMEKILHFDLEFYFFLRQRFYNLLHQMKETSKCHDIID